MRKNLISLDKSQMNESIIKKSLKIGVVGIGRIGLPTALSFAKSGLETVGVDINESLLEKQIALNGPHVQGSSNLPPYFNA